MAGHACLAFRWDDVSLPCDDAAFPGVLREGQYPVHSDKQINLMKENGYV
jgi:hypothetical protein